MTAPSPTVVDVLAAHPYTYPTSFCACAAYVGKAPWRDHAEHVAQALADAGVLGPEQVRTFPDTDQRDPGPRIVSLLRWVDALRAKVERVEALHHRYGSDSQNGFCSHCRASWPCPTTLALRGES